MLLLNNTELTYKIMLISFIDTSYIMCYHKLFISISCFCSGCWAVSKYFNNSFTSMINKQQKIILPSIAHHAISWSIAQPGLGFSRAVNTLPTLVYYIIQLLISVNILSSIKMAAVLNRKRHQVYYWDSSSNLSKT